MSWIVITTPLHAQSAPRSAATTSRTSSPSTRSISSRARMRSCLACHLMRRIMRVRFCREVFMCSMMRWDWRLCRSRRDGCIHEDGTHSKGKYIILEMNWWVYERLKETIKSVSVSEKRKSTNSPALVHTHVSQNQKRRDRAKHDWWRQLDKIPKPKHPYSFSLSYSHHVTAQTCLRGSVSLSRFTALARDWSPRGRFTYSLLKKHVKFPLFLPTPLTGRTLFILNSKLSQEQ